jgi:hypothetical protein
MTWEEQGPQAVWSEATELLVFELRSEPDHAASGAVTGAQAFLLGETRKRFGAKRQN